MKVTGVFCGAFRLGVMGKAQHGDAWDTKKREERRKAMRQYVALGALALVTAVVAWLALTR